MYIYIIYIIYYIDIYTYTYMDVNCLKITLSTSGK